MENNDIFSYIISEETAYQTRGVTLADGWEWSMYKHIRLSTLYKHGQLETGNDGNKPIENIIKPILNVAYRSEGFDVKDITVFVNDEKNYYKSFLTKKFHNKWARKYDLDTFIDELVESYCDLGGVLVKDVNAKCPEVVPLQRIAFCDQTDILAGVIAEKHSWTPDQLLEMAGKWDIDKINEAIDASVAEKSAGTTLDGTKNQTPQKYIEVYEIHGVLPTKWLSSGEGDEFDVDGHDYTRQAQYVTFASKKNRDEKKGIILWKGKEKKSRYKLLKRDPVYGRGLGYGGVEELFEPQVWTTYSNIKIKEMLDAAALMLLKTTDPAFAQKNKTTDLETGEIMVVAEGKDISQVQLQPINMTAFDNFVAKWNQLAKSTGSATDGNLAIRPSSGTPFALEQLNTINGLEMHQWRQGKIATFMGELYRDWILKKLVDEMNQGDKWVDELSFEELQYVAECVATNEVTRRAVEAFRKGSFMTREEGDQLRQIIKEDFKKSGSKKFIEIFKNEMKDLPIDVEVNIAGKQKDLAKMTEKLTNIFRQIFANPQVLAIPGMAKIFNQILESAGLSPVDFSGLTMQHASAMKEEPTPIVPDMTENAAQVVA